MTIKRQIIAGRLVISEEPGVGDAEESLKTFHRYRGKLGTVMSVEIAADKRRGAFKTFVAGSEATLVLNGLGFGYHGEPPRALHRLIASLGLEIPADSITREAEPNETRTWEFSPT